MSKDTSISTETSYETSSKYKPDSIIQSVISQFLERGEFGLNKYGTTLDRTDLNVEDCIEHMKQELMDSILYLERIKKEINILKQLGKEEKESNETNILDNYLSYRSAFYPFNCLLNNFNQIRMN
jgi:hypothetical protein